MMEATAGGRRVVNLSATLGELGTDQPERWTPERLGRRRRAELGRALDHLGGAEFELLGIEPGLWTPEVVISRHQGLLSNIGQELSTGRLVHRLGAETVKSMSSFGPGDPLLEMDPAIDGAALSEVWLYRWTA